MSNEYFTPEECVVMARALELARKNLTDTGRLPDPSVEQIERLARAIINAARTGEIEEYRLAKIAVASFRE